MFAAELKPGAIVKVGVHLSAHGERVEFLARYSRKSNTNLYRSGERVVREITNSETPDQFADEFERGYLFTSLSEQGFSRIGNDPSLDFRDTDGVTFPYYNSVLLRDDVEFTVEDVGKAADNPEYVATLTGKEKMEFYISLVGDTDSELAGKMTLALYEAWAEAKQSGAYEEGYPYDH